MSDFLFVILISRYFQMIINSNKLYNFFLIKLLHEIFNLSLKHLF